MRRNRDKGLVPRLFSRPSRTCRTIAGWVITWVNSQTYNSYEFAKLFVSEQPPPPPPPQSFPLPSLPTITIVHICFLVKCGETIYDPDLKTCCCGKLWRKQKVGEKCCGNQLIDTRVYYCCDDKIASFVSHGPTGCYYTN